MKTYTVEIAQRKLKFSETFTVQATTPLQAASKAMGLASDLPNGFIYKVRRTK
jgi:hypothetical protein